MFVTPGNQRSPGALKVNSRRQVKGRGPEFFNEPLTDRLRPGGRESGLRAPAPAGLMACIHTSSRMNYQKTNVFISPFNSLFDYTSVCIYTGVGMRCVCAKSHTHRLHAYVKPTSRSPSPHHRSKRTPGSPPLSRFLNLPVTPRCRAEIVT